MQRVAWHPAPERRTTPAPNASAPHATRNTHHPATRLLEGIYAEAGCDAHFLGDEGAGRPEANADVQQLRKLQTKRVGGHTLRWLRVCDYLRVHEGWRQLLESEPAAGQRDLHVGQGRVHAAARADAAHELAADGAGGGRGGQTVFERRNLVLRRGTRGVDGLDL